MEADSSLTGALQIVMSDDVSLEDREALLDCFRAYGTVHLPESRGFQPEWAEVLVLLKDAGAVAGAFSAFFQLANVVNQWKRERQSKSAGGSVKLRRPGKEQLDLLKASEEEVRAWLSQ